MKQMNTALKNIDWNLLQEQLTTLCFVQQDIDQDLSEHSDDLEELARLDLQHEAVEGVINLLGHLLDAAESDGLCVLKDLEEE